LRGALSIDAERVREAPVPREQAVVRRRRGPGPRPVRKSKFYGAFVLNRDSTPSTRRDFVKNYRAPDTR